MFIVDGIITLPVALYGVLLFPDTPATATAGYLSADERRLAVKKAVSAPSPFRRARKIDAHRLATAGILLN